MARVIRRYGRVLLLVGLANVVAVALLLSLRAHARPQDDGDGWSVVAEIRRLRSEAHDYDSARALAEQFLAGHPMTDQVRQAVEYEYALTYFDQQAYESARPLFEKIVEVYRQADFTQVPGALTDDRVVVDDAQYYAARTAQALGKLADAVTGYEGLFAAFPGSNRIAEGTLGLGRVYRQQGDLERAMQRFQQVVAEYPESEFAPEAQVCVGHVLLVKKEYNNAVEAFEVVRTRWPVSRHVAKALQFANRAFIHQELENWEPENTGPEARTIDNAAAIETNVNTFASAGQNDPVCAATLLDVLNYQIKRSWWNASAAADRKANVSRIAALMQQVVPQSPEAGVGMLALATIVYPNEPNQAFPLIEAAYQRALETNNSDLRNDAEFARAAMLGQMHECAAAQQAWSKLLEREQGAHFEGHVKLSIAAMHINQRQYTDGLAQLDELVGNTRYPDGVRATALLDRAMLLRRAGQPEAALAGLERLLADYPTHNSAETARKLVVLWSSK